MNVDDLLSELEDLGLTPGTKSSSSNKQPPQPTKPTPSTTSYQPQQQSFKSNNDFTMPSFSSPSQQSSSSSYTSKKPDNSGSTFKSDGGNIDDLLGFLQDEDYSIQKGAQKPFEKPAEKTEKPSQQQNVKQTKCLDPYLSNTAPEFVNDEYNMRKRICLALRCSLCHIQITKLEGYRWEDDTDLLFFRNNFSRKDKLLSSAISDRNYAAYSCQCKGKSVNKVGTLSDFSMQVWKCIGHTD